MRQSRGAADGRRTRNENTPSREQLPSFTALFRRGQLRWTVVGIVSLVCAQVSFFTISVLLPKALIDQGAAVSLSFGLSSLVFMASIPGKGLYRIPDGGHRAAVDDHLLPRRIAARTLDDGDGAFPGTYATVVFVAGALITGFTVLSTFTAVRVYLSEQFPTALRGRGQYFGKLCGRFFAGVVAPFLLEPYTGSPMIFFGTLAIVAAIGAFVPVLFGKETVGQLETVTEAVPELA